MAIDSTSDMSELIRQFREELQPLLTTLCKDGRFGVLESKISISDIHSSASHLDTLRIGSDCCTLTVPYACRLSRWCMMFDCSRPNSPPDWIFYDEPTFLLDFKECESYKNWDMANANSLLVLVNDIFEQFSYHHLQKLDAHSRCKREKTLVLENKYLGLRNKDVEVAVDGNSVSIVTKLPIDFSGIPSAFTVKKTRADGSIALEKSELDREAPEYVVTLARYIQTGSDHYSVESTTFCSDHVRNYFATIGNELEIRPIPPMEALVDYLTHVLKKIQGMLKRSVKQRQFRTEFMDACLKECDEDNPKLEYHDVFYTEMKFKMKWRKVYFLVTVEVDFSFPKSPPTFTLEAFTEFDDKCPVQENVKPVHYNAQHSMLEMAGNFVRQVKASMKENSVDESSDSSFSERHSSLELDQFEEI